MISSLINYKKVAIALLSIAFLVFVLFIFYQNKSLKTEVLEQKKVITSQNLSLNLWKQKQEQSIKAIKIKQEEIERIKLERQKNEQEFNKNASNKYHKWRDCSLPFDIVNRVF